MGLIRIGIYYLLEAYLTIIIVSIICSWIPVLYKFKFFRGLKRVADAYMGPFHGLLVFGGFLDFTPMMGIILYELLIRAYIYLAL